MNRSVFLLLFCWLVMPARATTVEVLRGTYVEVGAVGYFQSCRDSGHRLKVTGESAAAELSSIFSVLSPQKTEPIFVELRGHRRGGVLVVSGLERAQRESDLCSEILRNSLFKAFGSVPLWYLYVDSTGLRLKTLEAAEPQQFPLRRTRRGDNAWLFDARNGDREIHVALHRVRCVDATTGSRYSFDAEVQIGERRYAGCAYPGRLFR